MELGAEHVPAADDGGKLAAVVADAECDLIVEIVQRPGAAVDPAHDKLYGMSWRVDNAEATRARLLSAGVDVSEVRTGRKPGTRVLTVRSGTCGIPTLLVERTPRPPS